MTRKCEIMDSTIYSAPAMYSYFTRLAGVDNFTLLSPHLARPANQCPLNWLECSYVTGSSLSINAASAQILASSIERCSKQYNLSVLWVYTPGGCYRQMLITATCWPPATSQCTNNELNHLCCVVVVGIFLNLYFSSQGLQTTQTSLLARPCFTLITFHGFTPGSCPS